MKLVVYVIRSGETTMEEDEEDLRVSQRVDPPLTQEGHLQAQRVLLPFFRALHEADEEPRVLASFCAPLQSCIGTALMMSAARLPVLDTLRWGYMTVDCAEPPMALPVFVVNGLVKGMDEIEALGGEEPVLQSGLLHCANKPWNDGRNKCPLMTRFMAMKRTTREPIETWKNAYHEQKRKVVDVQYFRIQEELQEDENDIWNIKHMTPKVNIIVDRLEPSTYLPPPRSGNFSEKGKNDKQEREGMEPSFRRAIWNARLAGCDSVVVFVPKEAMKSLAVEYGYSDPPEDPGPCSFATIVATVNGDTADSLKFKFKKFFTAEQMEASPAKAIPKFAGPVDRLVEPPEGQDPMAIEPNQWSRFPPPAPEVIPDDYPDLPPFSEALEHDDPHVPRKD